MVGILQTAAKNGLLWPHLNDQPVALFPITATANVRHYAIPAEVNNHDAEIIVSFSTRHPMGKILGTRNRSGNVVQKGYDPINCGDKIAIYYLEYDFAKESAAIYVNETSNSENWRKGEVFTVTDSLELQWIPVSSDYKLGYRHTNIYHETEYSMPF